jgi:regulator of sigma E protease
MSHPLVYFLGVVGLLVLVFVHELGHFVAARLVGMRPTKFYIGFPPAVVRRVRGGIEYGIGAVPLGGYVKIPGMFRPAERDAERYFAPLAGEEPQLGPAVDDIRAALSTGDEAGLAEALDALERRLAGLPGTPVVRLALSGIDEVRESISPFAYWRKATWRRVVVIAAGPFANILAALVLLTAIFMLGVPDYTRTVAEVVKGSPAERVGIRQADTIVQLGTTEIRDPFMAGDLIQRGKTKPILVIVQRAGQRITLGTIAPRKASDGRYVLGFQWTVGVRKDSAPRAVGRATGQILHVSRVILTGLPKLIHPEQRRQVSSAVGIVKVSGDALRTNYRDYLGVVAFISISLAVLNLLPFLPLDGGHILVALVERLRRRPLRREHVERFSLVGFALVGILMYIGLTNDVHRYF